MNKIEIVHKKKEKYVFIKLSPTEVLNTREVELLGKRQVRYLISPEIKIKKKSELIYRVTNLVSLKEYLHAVTSKAIFLNCIISIIDMMKDAQQMMLYGKNFILNSDYIFVEPTTKALMYVYLPIVNYDAEYYIKNLFQSLVYDTVFNQLENCDYVRQYITYFQMHPNFSVFDFEMFIREMNGEEVKPGDKQVEIKNDEEKTISKSTMLAQMATQNPQANVAHPSKLLNQERVVSGTTVLGATDYGTTVLSPQQLNLKVNYGSLIRKKTGENIEITGDNFLVGQSNSADYAILDNTAVSRKHAVIINKNGKSYVIDQGSTNGTYIDDDKLTPNVETEICAGQRLRFADEEYEFMV